MTAHPRSSGVQLHVTSLPGGRLGAEAYRFVDWLAAAGQTWWQVLPLSPPDRHRSPYKARSAFATSAALLAPRARVSAAQALAFREREEFWIEDWIRFAGRDALADQVRFDREWRVLRDYAGAAGVRLLGDVAIYVAAGSVDHSSHPELFCEGAVAGAPPDAFSDLGQLWGNPLYDWPVLRLTGYRWWVERLRRVLSMFDAVRLDHFRGFVAYWAVPDGDRDARGGRWMPGPGAALFDAFERALGTDGGGDHPTLPLVAEDLGRITPAVQRLRDSLGLPGMLVLQFGFDSRAPRSPHRFSNHVENRFVYTGTHDHDTARGWYESIPPRMRARVDAEVREVGVWEPESWWSLVRLALASPARVAMVQAQDLLGLGSEARMNNPVKTSGNWRWQLSEGALSAAVASRLRDATEAAGRLRPRDMLVKPT
ncbi:MAG TPA: 4-alpha-glucanotransferase [Chloroflexota bacterium]